MVIHRLGELKVSVPLSLAQGIPGLLDAVPVTSPPVVEGSGTRSSAGSPQQAERTRVEERLQVSTGGSGSCPLSIVLPPPVALVPGTTGSICHPCRHWPQR